jgi:hypothetical protein
MRVVSSTQHALPIPVVPGTVRVDKIMPEAPSLRMVAPSHDAILSLPRMRAVCRQQQICLSITTGRRSIRHRWDVRAFN